MLTSITPLGERGRGNRWGVTAGFLAAGHVVGGAVLGGILASIAAVVRLAGFDFAAATTLLIVAAFTLAALMYDLAGFHLPGTRQVDELWLNQYRGWVYGVGFGVQLGSGFVTVVNTMLFPALVVAAAFVPARSAFALGVAYGSARAAMTLLNGRVATVEQLKALHRRLDRTDRPVRVGEGLGVGLGVLGVVALGWVG